MKKPIARKLRCAIYTRKSSEEGLDMEFNSLDAQREACEAFIASQKSEGWVELADRYDDGGFSGGTLERPALKRLLAERLEALDRRGLEPAIREFLNAVREPAFEEAPVVGRRVGLEEVAPLSFQVHGRRRLQRREPGKYGVGHQTFSVVELA